MIGVISESDIFFYFTVGLVVTVVVWVGILSSVVIILVILEHMLFFILSFRFGVVCSLKPPAAEYVNPNLIT